jgi:CheY-like chemotaxis protein
MTRDAACQTLTKSNPALVSRLPTVLIVEDDDDARYAMDSVLAREGYLVLTAATGRDAISTLQEPLSPIDVVLMDVHLPDVDGPALCARVRELYPELPIVVCSGEADAQEIAALLRLGAVRYFRKPVGVDELLSSVEAMLP